jgi:hypothetical protein
MIATHNVAIKVKVAETVLVKLAAANSGLTPCFAYDNKK